MPNWCDNKILVTTEKKQDNDMLIYLVEGVQGNHGEDEFDFEKVIPYPEEYAKMDAEEENSGFQKGGYTWCLENWGTKWNADESNVEFIKQDNLVVITFLTAWSPSIPVTKVLSEQYPTLIFEHLYEESGQDFSGKRVFVNGVCEEQFDGAFGDLRIFDDEYYDQEVD